MKILTALASAISASSLFVSMFDVQARKPDVSKLIGTYEIVSGERHGKNLDAGELKGVTVRIAANAITTFDKEKKEVYVATYKLDDSRKPWRITMTATVAPANDKGSNAEGLIDASGDTVKLIYALPQGKAPTVFKTDDKQQMFILKRTSAGAD
jgi:uncharacterized protein (TIGR03067 family)